MYELERYDWDAMPAKGGSASGVPEAIASLLAARTRDAFRERLRTRAA